MSSSLEATGAAVLTSYKALVGVIAAVSAVVAVKRKRN